MSTGDLVPEATDNSAEEYSSRGIGWTLGLGSRGKHPITSEETGQQVHGGESTGPVSQPAPPAKHRGSCSVDLGNWYTTLHVDVLNNTLSHSVKTKMAEIGITYL